MLPPSEFSCEWHSKSQKTRKKSNPQGNDIQTAKLSAPINTRKYWFLERQVPKKVSHLFQMADQLNAMGSPTPDRPASRADSVEGGAVLKTKVNWEWAILIFKFLLIFSGEDRQTLPNRFESSTIRKRLGWAQKFDRCSFWPAKKRWRGTWSSKRYENYHINVRLKNVFFKIESKNVKMLEKFKLKSDKRAKRSEQNVPRWELFLIPPSLKKLIFIQFLSNKTSERKNS